METATSSKHLVSTYNTTGCHSPEYLSLNINCRGNLRSDVHGLEAEVRFLTENRDFSLLHSLQTGSGAHLASYPMSTEDSIPEGKATWRENDHSLLSYAEVMNGGAIPPPPHTSSWRGV
jgi:hypothetical protein